MEWKLDGESGMKWQELYKAKIAIGLKTAIYKTTIRPVPMYASETLAVRKAELDLLERREIRMTR